MCNCCLCSYHSACPTHVRFSLDGLYALAQTERKETYAVIMSHHASGMAWCIMLSNHFRNSVNENLYINFFLCLNSRCERLGVLGGIILPINGRNGIWISINRTWTRCWYLKKYCQTNNKGLTVQNLEFGHPRCVCNNEVECNKSQNTTRFIG